MQNKLKKITSKLLHKGYSLLVNIIGKKTTFRILTLISSKVNFLLWGEYKDNLLDSGNRQVLMIKSYLEPIQSILESHSHENNFESNVLIVERLLEIENLTLSLLYKVDSRVIESDSVVEILRRNSIQRLNLLAFSNPVEEVNTNLGISLDESIAGDLEGVSIVKSIGGEDSIVTVVYPFRNRDVDRLALSIKSLLKFTSIPTKILVIDYGSSLNIKGQLSDFCKANMIDLVRVETEGFPWSRSRALNIGIKESDTKYVTTTDIDMIFTGDILKTSIDVLSEDSKVHCRPLWLKKDGLKANAWIGDFNQLGGFMFCEKSLFDKFGYFNEEIYYWGLEDIEFDRRMRALGVENSWIDDKEKVYHLWHEPSYGDFDPRPSSSWFDSNRELIETITKYPTTNINRVNAFRSLKRPILELNKEDSFEIKVDSYIDQLEFIISAKESHKFIYLNLGNRIVNSNAYALRKKLAYIDSFFNKNGAEVSVIKNKNFDYFYLSLIALTKVGLIDYFITDDYSGVYLLFN